VAPSSERDSGHSSGLTDALWRVGATALQLIGNRVELAAVELEEEVHGAAASLLWGIMLVAAVSLALAFVGVAVVLSWRDTHPVLAASLVAAVFGGLAGWTAWRWHLAGKARTTVLETTRAELRADLKTLRGAPNDHDSP